MRKRNRRARRSHRNPRLASRRGLGDAFYNILTIVALAGGGLVIYKSYGALSSGSGSDNLSARLGARLGGARLR